MSEFLQVDSKLFGLSRVGGDFLRETNGKREELELSHHIPRLCRNVAVKV